MCIRDRSGAGKSTLLYQLSALDRPSEGTIIIDGTDIVALSETRRTAFRLNTLGYVFQDYTLVPDLSALENTMMPLLMRGLAWKLSETTAKETLNDVGLHDRYDYLPAELSGGQQQRVALARAMVGKPKIIFADEPTANLDSTSSEAVILSLIHISEPTRPY